MDNANREIWIGKNFQQVGNECFPDNDDVLWRVLAIRHQDAHSFVEAEAQPATVGYPKFGYVFLFRDGKEPVVAGCYVIDDGKWTLLFSSGKVPAWPEG